MNLDIIPTNKKFNYDIPALNMLLRNIESTINDNPPVFAAVLSAIQDPPSDKRTETLTKKLREQDEKALLQSLTPGQPPAVPAVTPMHQMYIAGGRIRTGSCISQEKTHLESWCWRNCSFCGRRSNLSQLGHNRRSRRPENHRPNGIVR